MKPKDMLKMAETLKDSARALEDKAYGILQHAGDMRRTHDALVVDSRPPDLAAAVLARSFLAEVPAGLEWAAARQRWRAASHWGISRALGDGYRVAVSHAADDTLIHLNVRVPYYFGQSVRNGRSLWEFTDAEMDSLTAELFGAGWETAAFGPWRGENWMSIYLRPRGPRADYRDVPPGWEGGVDKGEDDEHSGNSAGSDGDVRHETAGETEGAPQGPGDGKGC